MRYQEIDGGPGLIKAETCDACRNYVKVLHQHKDPDLDPVGDDVGSLALDLLMRDRPYRRAGAAVQPDRITLVPPARIFVTLRRSKTDQEGAGRKVGIPFG